MMTPAVGDEFGCRCGLGSDLAKEGERAGPAPGPAPVRGERRAGQAADVNTRLAELTGEHITAKDFRTWQGTLVAFRHLRGELDMNARRRSRVIGRRLPRRVQGFARRLSGRRRVCVARVLAGDAGA
jgi:hypothetical protein